MQKLANRGLALETSIGLNSNNDLPVAVTGTKQMFESVVDQITVLTQICQTLKLFQFISSNFSVIRESDTEVTISRQEVDCSKENLERNRASPRKEFSFHLQHYKET